ncbi:hypothetical protein T12_718 [Trichinella patagoniensis]|uniref:Uncharacterized protein n=1 Tax=Trichinella patagoniensis TaxID=990121 RepID=A0A0V0Z085_9BILA|nr:hypothetical protein T12_11742 [Trichinella patagoniensis]KRY05948.1 hypothetical protein T12_12445 [Trichinella patagoniensis]KRY05951.1 hypothetical protein T12_718 [Trichinella patagoniensis]
MLSYQTWALSSLNANLSERGAANEQWRFNTMTDEEEQ